MAGKSSTYPNRLRETIKQSGLTIKEVAEESGIPLRTLSDYCSGNVPIPRRRLEDLALVIGCSPAYLVPHAPHRKPEALQPGEESEEDWISTRGLNAVDQLRRDILRQMKQFAALAGVSLLAPSEAVLNPDAWDRLLASLKKPTSIDEQTLWHLETLTETYCDLYHTTTAQADLLDSLSGHLMTVVRLLKTSQPSATQQRLCGVASSTAQMFGEICYGMENLEGAKAYYQLAARAAKESQNSTLQSIVLAREGFLPVEHGDPRQALLPLQVACTVAETSAPGKTQAWIMMLEAEALAKIDGKKQQCLDTLKKLEEAYYSESSSRDSKYADPRWTGFQPARMLRYKGRCYLDLREPEEARSLLFASLADLPTGPTRNRSTILVDLALSYVQSREIEEACETATQALVCAVQARSPRALQALRKVQQELHPWHSLACVKRLNNTVKMVALP